LPVTPFHFGIGLLGKGIAPARVHRWAHTLVGGTLVGLGAGLAWGTLRRVWPLERRQSVTAEFALLPAVVGGPAMRCSA
jgi:hypothetical protein